MNQLLVQIRELAPSAKEPLFRRLMVTENLSYLREKNSIIGFEVDASVEQALSGFTLIAIQKHTIYAYCSDLHEKPKLVLFPPIDKLFDPAFELLRLKVIKRRFANSKFIGTKLGSGTLETLVKDLTPPEKKVDISEMVAKQMAGHIRKVEEGRGDVPVDLKKEPTQVKEPGLMEEPEFVEDPPCEDDLNAGFYEEDAYAGFDEFGYDAYAGFDESGYDAYETQGDDYGEPVEEPDAPIEDERSAKLKTRAFESLSDVSDYCVGQLGVSRPLAVTLVNKALQSEVSPEYRIPLAIKLFCKLFDEKKI